ncbi:type VI secretion system tip protein TssI/VgrG [Pseudomonas beijingensis]|uniref:type VI secretion system tip protein TssI/VgrG n=1 Tax=Pseudomonas beijingensis TaxID=2954101 RepID=UPI002736A568|nr:type VI secretion system tip protein TssI/VgrG [Pseudomonas sp. FP2262]WLH44046.1 type VI secretion system tip protein TssI/VgrG [Pseudomonas sp. FP2262]
MFTPANQTQFSLTINGFEHDFQVLAFTGEEGINRPYLFNVECVSERSDLDLESLFDKEAFLTLDAKNNGIHGRVYHIAQSGHGQRLTHYRLALVPHLSYLRHRINQRIYQQFSAPKIVALILEEHGILGDAYRFHLEATYPQRDYCTQYDETDLHFIQRLCEEEGIHFHFQHSTQGHVLVFGDDQTVFPRIGQPTAYGQEHDRLANEPLIKRINLRLGQLTRRISHYNDDVEQQLDIEDVGRPERFTGHEHGKQIRLRTRERRHAAYREAEGQSDQTRFVSGHVVEISGHPREEWNAPWLLTQVIHEGRQPQVLDEHVAGGNTDNEDDVHQGYRNRFIVLPWNVSYRPSLAHKKPRMPSDQSAVVIALEDEEIQSDRRFARIKVRFPWDGEDRFDDKSCCWLKGGSDWRCEMGPPRTGMEVVVTFFENDPDRPLISGCLCCR